MSQPKYAIGLTSILAGLILTRTAVHYAYPTRGMSPEQIWHALPPALKTVVLAGSLLFGYGCWTLIKAALNRLGRKKLDPNPLAPTTPTMSSRFERAHPVAWPLLVGLGLLFALGLGFIRALVDLGGRPATAQAWGYFTGATFGPLILACLGVGIFYAVRKARRTQRGVISVIVGWTLLFSLLDFAGTAGRIGRSPHFPRGKQEFGRMMSQAYKEASGAVPPDQYSKDELATTMRETFQDVIQFRQQYQEAVGQFDTPEMSHLYTASSFRDRRTIEETMRQLRNMGPLEGILGMLPGGRQMMKQAGATMPTEKDVSRMEAIVLSMTAYERVHPEVLKNSRRRRIAAGSGTTMADVNKLLKGFEQMQSVMKSLGGKGGKGVRGRARMLRQLRGIDPSQLGLPSK